MEKNELTVGVSASGDSLIIVANGYVITCDPSNRGGRYNLLIRNGRIIEISDSLDLFTSLHPYATVIDASEKLIVPGFVNAHVHSESMLLRERTQDLHFNFWKRDIRLNDLISSLVDPANADDILSVYLAAYFSHLKSGTTLVCEYGLPFKDRSFPVMLQAMDRSDVKTVVTLQNWDQVRHVRALGANRPRAMVSLGAEEDYTVYSFENAVRNAKDLSLPLLAQAGEQREGVDVVRRNFQKNIIALLSSFKALQPNTVLVHCNHLSEPEIQHIEPMALAPVVCVRSAMQKQTGYPALRHLMSGRLRLCIGTDWGSSDMLKELQLLDQLPFLLPGLRRMSPLELLRMATINGAYALGLAGETGSIEAGKKADLTFFKIHDIRRPVLSPYATSVDLAAFLVRHLSASDVSDVVIDGEFYVRDGQLVTMMEEDIIAGFRGTWEKYFPFAPSVHPIVLPVDFRPAESPAQNKVKAPPFLPVERSNALAEGFEAGFANQEKSPGESEGREVQINLEAPEPPSKKIQNVTNLPQLPKDVKRVFGEDENY